MNCEDYSSGLRVDSFSCYLNNAEDNFVLKFGGSPVITSPEETPCSMSLGKSKNKDGEISIFGADNYFNMKMNYEHKKEGLKPNFRPKTPSVSSEASSWNSQAAFLQGLERNPSQVKHKMPRGRRFFPIFGCSRTCSNRKDVYISEYVHAETGVTPVPQQPSLKIIGDQFAFPVLNNSGMEIMKVKNQFEKEKVQVTEEPRMSIEVFGSNMTKKKGDIATNLERKLSILTWDAIPKAESLMTTTFGSSATICDDMASDASSDLFEIENISVSTTGYYPMLTRQPSENMSTCMTPTTQYAPSEASIEWSVITASAADFSSVVSEYCDEKVVGVGGDLISKSASNKTTNTKNVVRKDGQQGRPGGLLGCRSHKAVRVAESAYKTASEKPKYP